MARRRTHMASIPHHHPSPSRTSFLPARLAAWLIAAALFASGARSADGDFDWQRCAGQTLRVMLNRHPYSEGIRKKLDAFERLTGIKVAYAIYPEDAYFSRLSEAFDSESGSPDVYMTGAYQVWKYALSGHMMELDPFITNPAKTRFNYAFHDFFTNVVGAFRWDLRPGSKIGNGPLWAVPLGFETNALSYNREVFAQFRMSPPGTMEELLADGRMLKGFEGRGTYGVAVRGVAEWNTLHSGYMTAFVNYGARDMAVENGRLVAKVNSPEAVAVTELWVKMLRDGGPEEWETYDWYKCLKDFGDRKAAMLLDADILGYVANSIGSSPQAGKIGIVPPPVPAGDGAQSKSNLWVWGLAINSKTENPDAAWYFLQYFTGREFQLYSVLEWRSVNPPRRSVFDDPAFQGKMDAMEGYVETFAHNVENAEIFFTPTPYIFDISERWAAVIRDIATGMYSSTQEGMDALKIWMDNKLADLETE